MKNFSLIYYLYKSPLIYIIRIKALVLLWLVLNDPQGIYLVLISLFLMLEVFLRFKILRMNPDMEVSINDGKDILNSFTLKALSAIKFKTNTKDVVRSILKTKTVKFILEKSDILNEKEVKFVDVSLGHVLQNAFEIVKTTRGKYVTPADVFTSYMLLVEKSTKTLFDKGLKNEEFIQILLWARARFPQEEIVPPVKVELWGQGIGEDWVTGWTIEVKKYMSDMTSSVLASKPLIEGRSSEFEQLIEAMYKGKSALLVGEPGSGREEIAETLAYHSFVGNLKGSLYHQRLFELFTDTLVAGTQGLGDIEERLGSLTAEIAHAGNVIIYIPSFENIVGSATFKLDLSGVLTPYLEKGAIRIIGTMTSGAYKKFVEGKKTFANNIDVIKINEPSEEVALSMLFKKSEFLENSKTQFSYKALMVALKYSKKYLPDRVLPGSAITLLKDSIASATMTGKTIVEENDVIAKIEEKTHLAVGKPGKEEKKLLLNLEKEMHKRVIGQNQAVGAISEALRRIRTGLSSQNRPISFLFLGPTGVGKTETAKTLSRLYFGGEASMIRADMSEYSGDDAIKRFLDTESSEGGLIEKVFENPFSLILLDEFEKASGPILNLFLQVLDDGRLTDSKGRTVSFTNAIIIATSNAGSEFVREEVGKGEIIDKKFQEKLLELLQTKAVFKPELLNRFDGLIVFKPLDENEIKKIVEILLSELKIKTKEQDVDLSYDDKAVDKIVKEAFDREFGARPIRRYIQDNVEDLIAQKILKDEIKRGFKITFTVDKNNNLSLF